MTRIVVIADTHAKSLGVLPQELLAELAGAEIQPAAGSGHHDLSN